MKRAVAAMSAAALLVLPVAAQAQDTLDEILESAATAEFHGRGVVWTTWGDDARAAAYDVTRSNNMSMIHGPDGDLMLVGGLTATRPASDWYAFELSEWTAAPMSSRYSLSEPSPTSRLGRPATTFDVIEAGMVRARLVVDNESTVPLFTEIFDDNGATFRIAALIDFEPGASEMPTMPGEFHETMTMEPASDTGALPADLAGYSRADAYVAGNGVQAFYSDGLFSFSVFETKRGSRPDEFDGATKFKVNGEDYRRLVTASNVWVYWAAPNRSYVLVGDLPPDHLEQVLVTLPEPGDRAFFVRLWRRLFG